MGKHIEIIGLPGSGKTTFCRATLEYLEQSDVKVHYRENAPVDRRLLSLYLKKHYPGHSTGVLRKVRKYVQYGLVGRLVRSARTESAAFRAFVYDHTELVALILKILVSRAVPQQEKEHVLGLYFDSFAHFQTAQSAMGERETVLTDPGLVQRGIALLGYGSAETSDQDLYEYLRLTPRPDLVISVRTPPAVCLTRMRARGFPERLRGLNEQETKESLDKCQTCLRIAEEHLREQDVAVIEVENAGLLSMSIEKLRANLERTVLGT
jgi:thymidylate kinase